MYVARSRQKPPENAFQMRSRMKAEQEAAEAAVKATPTPVEQTPDLDALREAAARAAALVHGAETAQDSEPGFQYAEGTELSPMGSTIGLQDPQPLVEEVRPEESDKRGRPASSTVAERTARILSLIVDAGSEGISKPDLAAAVETKEANVQVALGKLKDAGKVESRRLPDTGKYRWFAV